MPSKTSAHVAHDSFIAWPNGAGNTPCSQQYENTALALDEADRLACEAEDVEDWKQFNHFVTRADALREQLHVLREAGHTGAPERYAQPCPVTALLGGAKVTAEGHVFNGDKLVDTLWAR